MSGCGSEVVSTQRQPAASPPVDYSGLMVHSLTQAGFSIGVPAGWTAMTGEDADRVKLDAVVADDPALDAQRALLTMPDSPMKLIGLGDDTEACTCSTISVMTFPLNDKWNENLADTEGFLEGVKELAVPGTTPTAQRVTTPIAEGLRITMRTTLPGSEIEVIMTQYYLGTDTSIFLVSYTSSPDSMKTQSRLFERSVQSLRLV